MATKDRSVEEIVEEWCIRFQNWKDDPEFWKKDQIDWLTQTLQAERQKRDEMVEAEKLKWVNGKRVSQFIGIDWNGKEVTEKYADDLELEPEEELADLVNEISKKMSGKFAGSYSIKVVRDYQEGQMSHPETGQWDFPPYYEIDSFYYRRDDVYQNEYKALTQPNNPK